MRHIAICGLPRSTVFFYILINGTIFEKKKKLRNKMCVLFSSPIFAWNISHSKKNWAGYGKNVYWYSCKVPDIPCPILMEL
jgi:hypothetical protein